MTTRAPSIAQTLLELEGDGLISRHPDEHDRRQVLIELTERGRGRLREDRRRREGWLAEAIAGTLTAEEQRTLIDALPLLRRLAQS